MKYALIGCSGISVNHLTAAKNNNLDIVAACDIIPEAITDKIAKCGIEGVNHYTDHKEMLDKEKPDLVAVCTDSGSHARLAIDALEVGCNVIIEKPIALSMSDANAIVEKAREKGLVAAVSHQNRFNPSVQKIKEAVDNKRFGKLYTALLIFGNRGDHYYEQSPWRGTWEKDGGCLMNQCIHNIDILVWMFGKPVEVMAYTDNLNHPAIEAEDLGLALIKFENGAYGIIEGTTNVFPKNLEETLYLFGDSGTVKAGGNSLNIIEEWNFADEKDDPDEVKKEFGENPPKEVGRGHTPFYADVISAIKENRDPVITAEEGRTAIEVILAIYKSSAEGKPVQFPIGDVATIDFKGRFA